MGQNRKIRVSRSVVGAEEAEAVSRVICEDGYLGMGKEVDCFEQELAQFFGVSRETVMCVSSGTAALHLAVEAVTNPGDEVLVPTLTYLASFQAVGAAGAVPIACDVVLENGLIDLADAEKRISDKTKAIMPVHYASNTGDLDAVYAFAKKHNLRVIEDAAHAFGCTYKDKKIGSFGDIVCLSFDGIKNITSGEGGVVVTQDEKAAQFIQDARLLGVKKDSDKRFEGKRSWDFDVTHQGYRYHMSNIMAAVGRVQLKRFEKEFMPKRQELVRIYRKRLSEINGIALFDMDEESTVVHIQAIRVLNGRRDALKSYLEEQNIETGIHYKPNHLLSFYGAGQVSLPVAEHLYQEILTVPLHPGLSDEDVNKVCECIEEFLKN